MSPDLFLHGCYETQHLQDANSVGVRSYGMAFNTFADIEKNLTDLGIIFGIEDRAQYVIDYCNNIKKIVETHVGTVAEADRPTVVVLGQQPGELASDIYDNMEEMIEIAGGISCTPDDLKLKTETTVVGLETIFKWNPDVVFLQDMFCEYTVDDLLNDSTWQSTKAVQNGNVFAIPCRVDTWCHSNPSCYLGILYMSMQMYPNLYEDIDIEKMVVDFYREIYGLDLTIEKIGLK